MQVRIESDGIRAKITNENGEPIGRVREFRIQGRADSIVTAEIMVYPEKIDTYADAIIKTYCPCCGQLIKTET